MWRVLAVLVAAACAGAPVNGIVYLQTAVGGNASSPLADLASILGGKGGWVSVVVSYQQPNISSTTMSATRDTLSASQLSDIVRQAQQLGLRVMVKPHVDLSSDPSHWRGQIGQHFSAAQWQQWFGAYNAFLSPLASLCSQLGVDALDAGTELSATESQEQLWRSTLAAVRKVFSGKLTYGCNHGDEGGIAWWDAVDWIGVDAYYPLGSDSSVNALVNAWQPIVEHSLAPLSAKWNRPILFTEVGYQSLTGAPRSPWGGSGTLSLTTQANCYAAVYKALAGRSFWLGALWWAFSDRPGEGGGQDAGFSMHNKPAAAVVSWQGMLGK